MSKINKSWTNSRIESKSKSELLSRIFGETIPAYAKRSNRDEVVAMAKSMRNADMNRKLNDR